METPHEKFRRIYPQRLRNASASIRTLGKLAHPYAYEATEADWATIINRLREDLRELEDAARSQVRAAQRKALRAQREEGVEPQGFSTTGPATSESSWTVG